jgi:N-acetylneuraminate synthase/N,N'-diacetyllegionaminate synthase
VNERVIIIAEAGVNHNGDFENAMALIKAAADAKVDYVKFQTFKTEELVSLDAELAKYQSKNSSEVNSQFNMLKKLEIPVDWYQKLIDYCDELGVGFLSTGFDNSSLDFLESFNPSFYKIPSGEITNKPYLVHIASKKKPIVLSTGMAEKSEIAQALSVLEAKGVSRSDITVLHCNTQYPTPMEDVNLKAMNDIGNEFNVSIGYSDHTLGIEVPIAAVSMGATVIEKHFTLDKTMEGPDHKASLDPIELKNMVAGIRNIELAISGSGIKTRTKSESENLNAARKSIHWKRNMSSGKTINEDDMLMIRPGNGISPMEMATFIGKKVNKNIEAYTMLDPNDIE